MPTSTDHRRNHDRILWIGLALAVAVGIAIRIHNAFAFRPFFGFDSIYNWAYIRYLTRTWTLPHPEAGWSTAHPPLFYYANAALCRLMEYPSDPGNLFALRLASAAIGLVTVALAFIIVRRIDPTHQRRAVIAACLVLFLPVHIYMSAFLGEEVLLTSLVSIVLVGVALELLRSDHRPLGYAAGLGVIGGLAFLTKLTGVLVLAGAAAAYLVDGWRRGRLRPAIARACAIAIVGLLVGGGYYVRNLVQFGYLYPHGLSKHEVMFTMPPGERHAMDYLRIPPSLWTDPQVLNPDLLQSIWGSTYLTMWFDGHRHFLPRDTPAVDRVGGWILALALLPTVAFLVGLWRGLLRALRSARGPDTLFLLQIALTLGGYVFFTLENPWFPVHKASFLLSLSVPFAYYTSEVLDDWTSRGRNWAIAIGGVSALLLLLILGTFTFTRLFWNLDHMEKTGVIW